MKTGERNNQLHGWEIIPGNDLEGSAIKAIWKLAQLAEAELTVMQMNGANYLCCTDQFFRRIIKIYGLCESCTIIGGKEPSPAEVKRILAPFTSERSGSQTTQSGADPAAQLFL